MQLCAQFAGRLPVVGVLGSGAEKHELLADQLGTWLAGQNVHLLTGGGGGVMEAVSRAFYRVPGRAGLVLGIIPGDVSREGSYCPPGYPNPWVELPVYTHLPLSGSRGLEALSRNHINVLTSSVMVALPGRQGTASEVLLAARYRRPLIAYVHQRNQIPDLPQHVPATRDFETIRRFILKHIQTPV
jgi:uncharacterized protein (TIGR00725 family)